MKRMACLALTLTLTGCLPARLVSRVGARGTVIDAHTRRPIAGAVVSVKGRPDSENFEQDGATAQTGLGGAFRVPAKTRIRFVMMDPILPAPRNLLTVSKPGYLPYHRELNTWALNENTGAVVNIGTVPLQPCRR